MQLISIHALREEGDERNSLQCSMDAISIHALREEGDQRNSAGRNAAADSYPRPPRGGRQAVISFKRSVHDISIHALREEGDASCTTPQIRRWISIHALREEGDGFILNPV